VSAAARRELVHTPWTPEQIARVRFVRWAVARGRMREGVQYGGDPRRSAGAPDRPRDWDAAAARAFELGVEPQVLGYHYW
jgi:hypothetical protein